MKIKCFKLGAENKIEEKVLVEKVSLGDEMAFELLFYRYRGKISNFVKRSIPAQFNLEETVNEIFLRVWINKERLDTNLSFEAYLFRIARNYVIDLLRKKVKLSLFVEEDIFSVELGKNTTEYILDEKELQDLLSAILNKMPPKRRLIFELNRFEDLSYREIATKLGLSENTVDTQIRRALQFLRKELNNGNYFF